VLQFADGLDRSQTTVTAIRTAVEPRARSFSVYCAQPRSRMLQDRESAVIMLGDGHSGCDTGWSSKRMRVLSDELSAETNQLVMLPDLSFGCDTFSNRDWTESTHNLTSSILNLSQFPERSRLLTDVLSVIEVAHRDHGVRRFSICGIGRGGGLALSLSVDLQAIAALACCQHINPISWSAYHQGRFSFEFDAVVGFLLTES
jgi:dienelactone hydrolase